MIKLQFIMAGLFLWTIVGFPFAIAAGKILANNDRRAPRW